MTAYHVTRMIGLLHCSAIINWRPLMTATIFIRKACCSQDINWTELTCNKSTKFIGYDMTFHFPSHYLSPPRTVVLAIPHEMRDVAIKLPNKRYLIRVMRLLLSTDADDVGIALKSAISSYKLLVWNRAIRWDLLIWQNNKWISIQTAGLAFGGTGLCSYRVRRVVLVFLLYTV